MSTGVKPFPDYPKSDPKFYYSKNKISGSPVIVFLHFFKGHQRILKRHIEMVNELGFDAFAYNMPGFIGLKRSLFYRGRIGLKHFYARMLSFYLDQIEGKKVVFAFSNPCASAIEVIYDRKKDDNLDIVGLICDSGPSHDLVTSAWNLALKERGEYSILSLFAIFWSIRLHRDVRGQLRKFPSQFPILSIRGGADVIIPPNDINKIFKDLEDFIRVNAVTVPGAGHLQACKLYPEIYRSALANFLNVFK